MFEFACSRAANAVDAASAGAQPGAASLRDAFAAPTTGGRVVDARTPGRLAGCARAREARRSLDSQARDLPVLRRERVPETLGHFESQALVVSARPPGSGPPLHVVEASAGGFSASGDGRRLPGDFASSGRHLVRLPDETSKTVTARLLAPLELPDVSADPRRGSNALRVEIPNLLENRLQRGDAYRRPSGLLRHVRLFPQMRMTPSSDGARSANG
jgi:hypothetical protein